MSFVIKYIMLLSWNHRCRAWSPFTFSYYQTGCYSFKIHVIWLFKHKLHFPPFDIQCKRERERALWIDRKFFQTIKSVPVKIVFLLFQKQVSCLRSKTHICSCEYYTICKVKYFINTFYAWVPQELILKFTWDQ